MSSSGSLISIAQQASSIASAADTGQAEAITGSKSTMEVASEVAPEVEPPEVVRSAKTCLGLASGLPIGRGREGAVLIDKQSARTLIPALMTATIDSR